MPRFFRATMALITVFLCGPVEANKNDVESTLCDSAARIASQEFGIPVEVLLALTRTETGRNGKHGLYPWPWTVNMEGPGYWFGNRDEAVNFTLDHLNNGAISFDIGCFQINYKWHGEHFDSVEDMFVPRLNANYAAQFLTQLFFEFGSWSAAAGAFHSRTPSKAESYIARFDRIRLIIRNEPPETVPVNLPPLGIFDRRGDLRMVTASLIPLVSGGAPKLGSLFPNVSASVGINRQNDTQNQGS